jgi:hypothetical protein
VRLNTFNQESWLARCQGRAHGGGRRSSGTRSAWGADDSWISIGDAIFGGKPKRRDRALEEDRRM